MASASPAAPPPLRLEAGEKDAVEAAAAVVAALASCWLFYPLDTLKTRLQAEARSRRPPGGGAGGGARAAVPPSQPLAPPPSLASVCKALLAESGPGALYAGVGVKTVHSALQAAVFAAVFARLRRAGERRRASAGLPPGLGVGTTLGMGLLAAIANVLLTEPLDTLATARQTRRRAAPPPPPATAAVRRPSLVVRRTSGGLVSSGSWSGSGREGGEAAGAAAAAAAFAGSASPARAASAAAAAAARSADEAERREAEAPPAGDASPFSLLPPPGRTLSSSLASSLALPSLSSLRTAYRSLSASLLLTINPALQYTAFEQLKAKLLAARAAAATTTGGGGKAGAHRAELSAAEAFVLGALAKAIATCATYPAIRAKVLLQTAGNKAPPNAAGSNPPPPSALGLVGTARQIVRDEGPAGLYAGLTAQLLKTVLVAAFQAAVKEKAFALAYRGVRSLQQARGVRHDGGGSGGGGGGVGGGGKGLVAALRSGMDVSRV